MKKIVFYVVAFDPKKIWACQAHQNICLKLNFVKDNNVVGQKMTRNGQLIDNSVFYASDYIK